MKKNLHGKIAASVLFKLLISGNERCHTTMLCSLFKSLLMTPTRQTAKEDVSTC